MSNTGVCVTKFWNVWTYYEMQGHRKYVIWYCYRKSTATSPPCGHFESPARQNMFAIVIPRVYTGVSRQSLVLSRGNLNDHLKCFEEGLMRLWDKGQKMNVAECTFISECVKCLGF